MTGQLIDNWNELYKGEDVPQWEDLQPNIDFCNFLKKYIGHGDTILELGSGLGHNAIYLAKSGFDVTASDISENAVNRVSALAKSQGVSLTSKVLDVLDEARFESSYSAIFEKGCFHSFFTSESRLNFSEAVSNMLPKGGVWISSSGSADNLDDPNDPYLPSYPRLSLGDISAAVEPYFEILEVRKGSYGSTGDRQFKTWECAFAKR